MIRASLLLAAVAFASPSTASAGLTSPRAGERVTPGSLLALSVPLANDARREADEMELLLSLDGGRTFPVRITSELSPTARVTWWRVPNLPTAHARLALRTGTSERDEVVRAVSEEFAVDAAPDAPLEVLERMCGEWGTREAVADRAGAELPDAGFAGPPDSLEPGHSDTALEDDPVTVSARPDPSSDLLPSSAAGPVKLARPTASHLPVFRPKRE